MLFEPIKIGTVELKNRIVMAPVATHFADEKGVLTERQIDYYSERAKGGAGLIITESCCVRDDGKRKRHRLSISEDEFVPRFKNLARAVHSYGAKIAMQLHHGGRLCTPQDIGEFPISASTVPCPLTGGDFSIGNIPRALKKEEIRDLIERFGEGARRAYEAEFDLIQIHAAHGYLINNFLSPESNKRKDKYGGNLDNRMRFLTEIIKCVRRKTDGKLPIMVRLNGGEFIAGGYGLEEAKRIAKKLEGNGVDEINITAGNLGAAEWSIQPAEFRQGCLTFMAQEVRKSSNIPVSTVGKMIDPQFAEKVLSEKRADLIYFGRALLADPELPIKAQEGRFKEIRRCISCMNCMTRISRGMEINCSVNAQVGREKEYAIRPTVNAKKILIIGGGPAGMEAARVLSLRRHSVTLCDKSEQLGGQLNIASIPPYRQGIKRFVNFLENELRSLKVNIRLNCEWKGKAKEISNFDVIIFATGSKPINRIDGILKHNILHPDELFLSKRMNGQHCIVVGGGAVGLQCADFLAKRKKGVEVIVIEKENSIGRDMGNVEKKMVLNRLLNKGVRILINSKILKAENNNIIIESDGEKKSLKFDTLISAVGRLPNDRQQGSLKKESYSIGDCSKIGKIIDAVHEAYKLALKI